MELIVNNKDDFELLKQYASYSSDLTGVIEIESSNISYVLENYKDIIEKYTNISENISLIDNRPELFCQNGKLFVGNIDDTLSLYLDLPFNKEVKQSSFDKIIELLDNNMIKIDDSARHLFSQLTNNSKISELYCSRFNTNYKHKRWSLCSMGENAIISDLKFEEREIDTKTYKVYKYIKIDRIEEHPSEKYKYVVYGSNDFNDFEFRFFWLSFAQQNTFTQGMVVNVMTEKTYGGKGKKILINPEVIPGNFPNTYIRKTIKTSKRDIPVKLLRDAFMEYSYRSK